MRLEDELTNAFIDGYHVAGKEVGYWGSPLSASGTEKWGVGHRKKNAPTQERWTAKGIGCSAGGKSTRTYG